MNLHWRYTKAMLRRAVNAAGASIAIGIGVPAPAAAQAALPARIDAYFQPLVDAGLFRGVVLVARGDTVLFRRAFGAANIELGVANTPGTRYHIASLTKTFTAAAITMLVEQGKLAYSDRLSRFVPDFPSGDKIKIEDLLLHQSGVANPDYLALGHQLVPIRALVAEIARHPLQFEPGSKGAYSNAGYNILAYVVQQASEKPYDAFLRDRIYRPLGLTCTGQTLDGSVVPERASGYQPGPPPTGVRDAPMPNLSVDVGSGSLYSCVDDLYRWLRAVRNDEVFKRSALEYPYGWGRRNWDGIAGIEQSGFIDGYASNIAMAIDSAAYAVVLTNASTPGFGRWGKDLVELVLGRQVAPLWVPPPPVRPPTDFGPYTGRYRTGDFTVRVVAEDGSLYIELGGSVARYLAPTGPDQFALIEEASIMTFAKPAAEGFGELRWGDAAQGGFVLERVR